MHLLDKNYWPVKDKDWNSLYTIEATAYALMQKLELGLHNETRAIAKWLLEKRELGGGFKSTQVTRACGGWGLGRKGWGQNAAKHGPSEAVRGADSSPGALSVVLI